MKIKEFLKENITAFLSYLVIFILYRKLLNTSVSLLLTVFLVLYGSAIAVSQQGKTKLLQFEKSNALTTKKLLSCSILIALPIYLFWFLFSMIPISSYEAWLMTGFPMTVISALPLHVLSKYWHSRHVFLFWTIQVMIYILFFILGQGCIHYLFD